MELSNIENRLAKLADAYMDEVFDKETESNIPLFNPRQQNWHEHFQWSKDGTKMKGKTAIGRVTILTLDLNKPRFIRVRKNWVSAGWHPPKD